MSPRVGRRIHGRASVCRRLSRMSWTSYIGNLGNPVYIKNSRVFMHNVNIKSDYVNLSIDNPNGLSLIDSKLDKISNQNNTSSIILNRVNQERLFLNSSSFYNGSIVVNNHTGNGSEFLIQNCNFQNYSNQIIQVPGDVKLKINASDFRNINS